MSCSGGGTCNYSCQDPWKTFCFGTFTCADLDCDNSNCGDCATAATFVRRACRGHIVMPRKRSLAKNLRKYLRRAGIERAELFINDVTRIHTRFHDLRATCVSWMAVRGDTAERIMQRVGHEDWRTMKRYMRTAEALANGFGEVFGRLPASLVAGDFSPPTNRTSAVMSTRVNGHANGRIGRARGRFDRNKDPRNDPQLRKRWILQRRGRDSKSWRRALGGASG